MNFPTWLLPCLGGAVLVGLALAVAGVSLAGALPFVAVLACPLMMVVMMRGMHGGHQRDAGGDHAADHVDRTPEPPTVQP